ncbi:MAG: prolipoprotein diacylglyceryl transferase [Bacteroidetes bacterium]|nr:prolipoprotein diacylglyceryl transferase [Bacteroidota bacterium]
MYPTIYHLVKDLFGFEIGILRVVQSFGFFVAFGFLSAAFFWTNELKRKEELGLLNPQKVKRIENAPVSLVERIFMLLISFVLGFKLLGITMNYDEFIQKPPAYLLSAKGNLFGGIIGLAIAWYMQYSDAKKLKGKAQVEKELLMHPYEHVGNMIMIAVVSGILGAKIFHNLENPDEFMADPVGAMFSFSGLTMYGGLILGAICVIYYAKRNKLTVLHVVDASAPAIMLGYAVGRVGCQVAGDGDWGIDNLAAKPDWMSFLPDWMWAYNYPHNVNSVGIPIPGCMEEEHCAMLANPVFPTPFYETIMCTFLFGVLWMVRKKIQAPGLMFSLYLLLNGIERFLIESIRVNSVYHIFGRDITQAQIISSILILLGIAGIVYFRKKHSNTISQS